MLDYAPNLALTHPTWSAGGCSAQRIKISMIAGGNHTTINMTPPYKIYILYRSDKLQIYSSVSMVMLREVRPRFS